MLRMGIVASILAISTPVFAVDQILNPDILYQGQGSQFSGGAVLPKFAEQVDYPNAFLGLRQYNTLSPTNSIGGVTSGILISSGFIRPNDLIAASQTVLSIQQRLDDSFRQIQQIQQVQQAQQHQFDQIQRGIAAVAAMTNSGMPSAPGRTTWAVNGSLYEGGLGSSVSIAHRMNFRVPIAFTAAYGNGGGTAHVARIGLMGEF